MTLEWVSKNDLLLILLLYHFYCTFQQFETDHTFSFIFKDAKFWVSIERVHSAARSFERELWAENRTGSIRVWEILVHTRSQTSLTLAKDRRIKFFQELEERGEAAIMRALDALSAHIQWILVSGGESTAKTKTTAGNRLFAGSGGVSIYDL